jgi:hypothetical protein
MSTAASWRAWSLVIPSSHALLTPTVEGRHSTLTVPSAYCMASVITIAGWPFHAAIHSVNPPVWL